MSTKKQISSLCKLYSVYEEIPEECLDETDVDSYFYHNILDISHSHHRIVRVSKGSNTKFFAFELFFFAIQSYSSDLFWRKKSAFPKKLNLLDSLGELLKFFDQANKLSQIPFSKPKLEIGFTKAKDELFSHCYKDIVEQLNRQTRLSFRFQKNKTWVFSTKKFEHYGDQFILTEVVAKSNISTRIDFLLLISVTFLRAITMYSALNHDCGYDNSTFILIGDVYCPNSKCLGKFCLNKKTFHSLGRNDYQCPQCASVCQVRNIPFEDQTNSFLLSLGQGVYIFEENTESIQDVIGDVYCPGEYCLNREKSKSVGGYVKTSRSIYSCDNCGVWLFVHKVPFTLQELVKTTKIDKTRFIFAKKMLHDKQLFNKVPFQSTKYGKKELCVENKVRETIGDVFCPTCRNEKCVYISTNKTTSF